MHSSKLRSLTPGPYSKSWIWTEQDLRTGCTMGRGDDCPCHRRTTEPESEGNIYRNRMLLELFVTITLTQSKLQLQGTCCNDLKIWPETTANFNSTLPHCMRGRRRNSRRISSTTFQCTMDNWPLSDGVLLIGRNRLFLAFCNFQIWLISGYFSPKTTSFVSIFASFFAVQQRPSHRAVRHKDGQEETLERTTCEGK